MKIMTEKELLKLLEELPDGTKITLKDLAKTSAWFPGKLLAWLGTYMDRPMKVVERLKKGVGIEDSIFLHGLKDNPVFRIGTPLEPLEPETEIAPLPPSTAYLGGQGIDVPVNTVFSERELLGLLKGAGLDADYAQETMEWWLKHGRIDEEQGFFGTAMYRTIAKTPAPKPITRIIYHKLPRTRWYVSRKGGLYDYLQKTFGWTRTQAVEYFRSLDTTDRLGVGYYRLPREIPIEETLTVEHREEKPLPKRYLSILTWNGSSDSRSKEKRYNQTHEINVFIRLPSTLSKDMLEQLLMDAMNKMLKENIYPELREILHGKDSKNKKWHGSKWFGSTTTEKQEDGYYRRLYSGGVADEGFILVDSLLEGIE